MKCLLRIENVQKATTKPPHSHLVAIPSNLGTLYKMASAATYTVTAPLGTATIAIPKNFGNYKEQASGAQSYNKELEEHGDANHPKAKVMLALPSEAQSVDVV